MMHQEELKFCGLQAFVLPETLLTYQCSVLVTLHCQSCYLSFHMLLGNNMPIQSCRKSFTLAIPGICLLKVSFVWRSHTYHRWSLVTSGHHTGLTCLRSDTNPSFRLTQHQCCYVYKGIWCCMITTFGRSVHSKTCCFHYEEVYF